MHHEAHQARFPRFCLTASRMSCSISAYALPGSASISTSMTLSSYGRAVVTGDILERHEGRGRHEELAEDQR